MQVEHRIVAHVEPEAVYRIYEDVGGRHIWDSDTKLATLDGPLRVGARGRLTPTKGQTVPMLVTQVVDNRSFTVESKIPLFRMLFDHELHPCEGGTEIVHRVSFSRLLSLILGPMLSKQLNSGLQVTLGKLKKLAESNVVA